MQYRTATLQTQGSRLPPSQPHGLAPALRAVREAAPVARARQVLQPCREPAQLSLFPPPFRR